MRTISSIIICILALMAAVSCQKREDIQSGGPASFRLSVPEYTSDETLRWESSINSLTAVRVEGGRVAEVFSRLMPGSDGQYSISLQEYVGEMYFIANVSDASLEELVPGAPEETVSDLAAETEAMAEDGLAMTGKVALGGSPGGQYDVRMKRAVAKIMLVSEYEDVEVLKATVSNIRDKGYLFESQRESLSPENAGMIHYEKEYGDLPLSCSREILQYIGEQSGRDMSVEIYVSLKGALHRLTARMPEKIARNSVYSVNIYGYGGKLAAEILSDGWEAGGSSGSDAESKARINISASSLPQDAVVSPTLDTLYIPYTENDFIFAVDAEPGSAVEIKGNVERARVSAVTLRSLERVAEISVESSRRMPGSKSEYVYVDVVADGLQKGRVVLVFRPNPVVFSGDIVLDSNGVCDFGKYIEGELGYVSLPEGKILNVCFDDGTGPWVKAESEGNTFRILGGWKPNDPTADGRRQEARIVITDADGTDSEEYVIARRNWGLPVVNINGTWWCKYNMRGDTEDFAQQVSIQDDISFGDSLAEYLQSCSDEELLEVMGGQYQSWSTSELPLRYDGSVFYHEGMKGSSTSWGSLQKTDMAPEGYRLPDFDDYAFFVWDQNSNIGGVGTRQYRNRHGDEITVTISEREANFLGGYYGIVSFYDFDVAGQKWTLFGLGHQWDTTAGNIAKKNILMATWGSGSSSWGMEGYAQNDRPGQNWFKYSSHNNTKTRMVRCIKEQVEYIYN